MTLIQYGEYVNPVQTMRFMLHGCVSGRVDYFLRSAEHYPPKKYEARLVVLVYTLCSLGPFVRGLGDSPRRVAETKKDADFRIWSALNTRKCPSYILRLR